MPVYKTSKAEILEKAAVVFREKGYFHTSIQDLAAACNVEKPHLYYYFKKGKSEMMMEVLKYVDGLMEKYICELAYNEKYSAKERLGKMLARMNKFYLTGQGGCIFANTLLETADATEIFKPIIKETFDKWAKALGFVLQEKHTEEKAMQLAYTIIQDMEGGLMMYQLYKDEKFLKLAAQRSASYLEYV